jgi:hydroxymethylglutaryl-CoA synthase
MNVENNVGILGMEVYFPSSYIVQSELVNANGVDEKKDAEGLGYCGDREDVNSISLTVVQSLLEKYGISRTNIGRLEVGTESLVDKSKSTKTVLMSLFEGSGNTDIEGATVINDCYGGTAALLNALMWVDSSSWDGRYAIVVAADIAVYADGSARPTGGCGAVAMLVGRNAPLKVDLRTRTTHATNVWDSFKPNTASEDPKVNEALSEKCYLQALDDCYTRYIAKTKAVRGNDSCVSSTNYFLFHSPYNKLVQKAFGRLAFLDLAADRIKDLKKDFTKWLDMPLDETYEEKDLHEKLRKFAEPLYNEKVATGCEISKQIGNSYTASVFMNLACLISTEGASLSGKSISLFSYGSGAMASMLSIVPSAVGTASSSAFSLRRMQEALDIKARLTSREKHVVSDLTEALKKRENALSSAPYSPVFSTDDMFPGAFYLEEINAASERVYRRKSLEDIRFIGGQPLADVGVTDAEEEEDDSFSNRALTTRTLSFAGPNDNHRALAGNTSMGLKRNQTMVWASGRPNVRVVVTGIAAALPGRTKDVFAKGVSNVQRIIAGETFIGPIPDTVKDSMLDKNVALLSKNADGSQTKIPIKTHESNIQLCATIGNFNLTSYGVPESIAMTMDRAVQVAVAAGLEALKDAGIVTGDGEGLSGWVLPLTMQDTTGVVYATSFPALDAAIEEVSKFFETKTIKGLQIPEIITGLRSRLESSMGKLSPQSELALAEISKLAAEASSKESPMKKYEFDRKFLFRVLVLGNAQLAQIVKAKGPNMQTNAACAGDCYQIICLTEPTAVLIMDACRPHLAKH